MQPEDIWRVLWDGWETYEGDCAAAVIYLTYSIEFFPDLLYNLRIIRTNEQSECDTILYLYR